MFRKSSQRHRFRKQGISPERAIRFFFASNAGLTIVILILIIVFLLREGLGFFPGYRRELEIYRRAGLEFVDISRKNLTAHEQLSSLLNRAYFAELNGRCASELRRSQEASAMFNAFVDQTTATRELLLSNQQEGVTAAPEMLASLRANHERKVQQSLAELPGSPHLSAGERAELLKELAARRVDEAEAPPLVTSLEADYAAAQEAHAPAMADFRGQIDAIGQAGDALSTLVSEMSGTATSIKEVMQRGDALRKERQTLSDAAEGQAGDARAKLLDELPEEGESATATTATIQDLLARRGECRDAQLRLRDACMGPLAKLPEHLSQAEADRLLRVVRRAAPVFLTDLERAPERLAQWNPEAAVPLTAAIGSFLTGKDWVTGGEWQDFYGILPLFVGSLMISLVALLLAIPSGVGAAIYINQFASSREQAIIKPVIEFIQAIPSVVLGFIGILVLGNLLRDLSQLESLSWVPGFPIDERLNIFTAACLLAWMAIPTIFSLAEDALNNVPSAYSEAADALGASRIQTSFRVIIPAAFSGIMAAVLLGLGRVIGETMVVLLVAGNRIKIPDFTSGLGVLFQPTHTLTGIIAQELGEVPMGSVHYRALFVIGILLFAVVLVINASAHRFVTRNQH